MSKKIILIIGILVVIGIGLFLVFSAKPSGEGGDRPGFSFRGFLPFGNSEETPIDGGNIVDQGNGTNQNIVNNNQNQKVPRIRKISKEPVAGAVVWNIGTSSFVRFVEKGTGNVYEANSENVSIQRLTNTTIPQIIRAFWLPDGSGFLAQTLIPETEIIETTFVKLVKNTATSSTEILTPFQTVLSKLPTDIKEVTIKPDGTKIFYYTIRGAASDWFVANPDGTGATLVNSHSLTELLAKWQLPNTITLQTKSSASAPAYLYSFDISSKTLRKIGFGAFGLSVTPNLDNTLTLLSKGGTSPSLAMLDNGSLLETPINANTLADKCLWLGDKSPTVYCAVPNQIPSSSYPDAWYQGLVSTEDSWRKIDINNDVYYTLSDLSRETKEAIDVISPKISKDESHLIFQNKKDGFLWLLRVEQ